MFDGHFVTVCPPGLAQGAFYLRDRGRSDIFTEITVWPTHEHHGKLTTTSWRSVDDRIHVEDSIIRRIDRPREEDRIRETWLGRQWWASHDLQFQAQRILAWFHDPSATRPPTRYWPRTKWTTPTAAFLAAFAKKRITR